MKNCKHLRSKRAAIGRCILATQQLYMPSCYYTTFHYITNVVFVECVHRSARHCLFLFGIHVARFTYIMSALACTLKMYFSPKVCDLGKGLLDLRSTPHPQAADRTSSRGPVTSMTTASSLVHALDNFVMSLISYIDPPHPTPTTTTPQGRVKPPPSPLRAGLQCCCQNLTPLPEDTAMARRECGSTALSSRVPHATPPPVPHPEIPR